MDTIISDSPEATLRIAADMCSRFGPGAIVSLHGDLGAGKTHFVKGLAAGCGFSGGVTSPTFALLQEYRGSVRTLWHADLYRLETPEECLRIGLEDVWGGTGLTAIEWPERLGPYLPGDAWVVRIETTGEKTRTLTVSGGPN